MNVLIKSMEYSDIDDASYIFYKSFNSVGQKWTLEFTKKRIEQYFDQDTCWVALADNKIVGILTSKVDYVLDHKELYIDVIAVLPEFNKLGIGTSLIQHATNYATNNNLTCLWLLSNPNIYSYNWYISSGFRESSWKVLTKNLN